MAGIKLLNMWSNTVIGLEIRNLEAPENALLRIE
jgi:hypothetical protein